jgi:adenine-specific DNA-methyltransferase
MATLNWIGKEAVANHDKEVPFKLLSKVPGASVGKESKNLIIHGDNLEALKALMPFYQGKVKCIYIDPPYNTGNEGWVYNDKVNSPKIREWLKRVVGREGEDLTRHDKWLCMMYPRLKLLRDLLTDDGAIFVSIDDNEQHHLRLLMDEIFIPKNFIANIIWQKKYTQSNDAKYFSDTHDFLVAYAKDLSKFNLHKLTRTEEQNARYLNPDKDPRGPWMTQPLHAKSGSDNKYSYTFKNGTIWAPPNGTFPRYTKTTLEKAEQEGQIWFGAKGTAVPRMKKYLNEMSEGVVPRTLWLYTEVGSNDDAKKSIKELFGTNPFESPKPVSLIRRVLELCSDKDSIILDSFAGSGTTGHATLELNSADEGSRQFILVEVEDEVAKKITAERVKRAIKKFGYSDGFEYCELDKPLFDEKGQINEECSYDELATYIYFSETQTNLDKKVITAPLVGEKQGTSYFLLYSGKDKNDLTRSELAKLKIKGPAVIYADRCLLDEDELKEKGIVFKQIPYEIKVF